MQLPNVVRTEDAVAGTSVTLSPGHPATLSSPPAPWRAWFYLVWLSMQRQARARQMVWIALALLGLTITLVAINTARNRWGMDHWRAPRGTGPRFDSLLNYSSQASATVTATSPLSTGVADAVLGACRAVLDHSGFMVFCRFLVYSIFISFLLPLWSLSFATEALGGEREAHGMVWLVSRPLPRPAIYLAKFAALLPWSLALNVGGFALLCLAAGDAGRLALRLFWPAVAWATLAFCALFYMMGALFHRPAVVAIVYAFFLETILGNMPGYMKRFSVGFYARCLMFEAAEGRGVEPPEKASIYLPVDGTTALVVLLTATVALLLVGMWSFGRSEYCEEG
jgi:hypothetical protein